MKKFFIFTIVLVTSLVLSSCGDDGEVQPSNQENISDNTENTVDTTKHTLIKEYIQIGEFGYKLYSDRKATVIGTYLKSNGKGFMDYYSPKYSGNIEIPSHVNYEGITYKVTSLDGTFHNSTDLLSVKLPNTIEQILNSSFYNCTKLTSVSIPENVHYIATGAFENCSSLKTINIPKNVTNIQVNAFVGCEGLDSVIITDIEAWSKIKFKGNYANPLMYANHLYLNGEKVTSIIMPSSIDSVGDYAFQGGNDITSITLSPKTRSIGVRAFEGCQFSSIEFPSTLKSIDCTAFYGNGYSKLRTVICNSLTVPTIVGLDELFDFDTVNYGKLYVHKSAIEQYKADKHWGRFTTILPIETE